MDFPASARRFENRAASTNAAERKTDPIYMDEALHEFAALLGLGFSPVCLYFMEML